MTSVSSDALLTAAVTLSLAFGAGLWKLASMLAEIRAQIRNNGGSSIKDHVERIDKKLDNIENITAEAATVAGIAISRAEKAVAMVEAEAQSARDERAFAASEVVAVRAEVARAQGGIESLERTLALTVVTSKPIPRKRTTTPKATS